MSVVRRDRPDALGLLWRYAGVSAAVGVAVLGAFLYFSFVAEAARMANMAVVTGVLAHWVAFLLLFLPARSAMREEMALGAPEAVQARFFIAAAVGETGWILVFFAALMGTFVTKSLISLGYPQEMLIGAAFLAIMLPGATVLGLIVLTIVGAKNARG
ncbi:MAG: hypothetical protein AAGI70_02855 [Pseudomonadota bacterium]